MANLVRLGFVAFACTKYAFKSSSTADRALPVIANRTVIIVDSNGTAVPTVLEGSAAVVDSAAKAEPAVLDGTTIPKGTAVVVETHANALPRTLNGTAVVVDSDANEDPAIPKGTAVVVDTDADAEPGILNGTAVAVDSGATAVVAALDGTAVVVDSAATPEQAILDGTPVVMVNAADAEQAILDGTAVVVDCDANELHRTTASYGAKAATVVNLLGAPVTSTVGAAAGGGLAWLSSKLGRKTTSGNKGCDPGCDVEEKSQERCFACGTPVAAPVEPGILNGTAVAVDSAANADLATLDGNAVVVDSAATPEQAILDGTPVVMVSAADAEQAILDGTPVVMVNAADAEQAILDGTDVVGDCNEPNKLHRTTASSGAKAATVVFLVAGGAVVGCVALPAAGLGALSLAGFTSIGPAAGSIAASWMSSIAISNGGGVAAGSLYALLQSTAMSGGGWLLGAPVTSTVGAVAGGGLAWLSSKHGRKTTSGNRGYDPGCDIEEKSQERCFACGTPVAAPVEPGILNGTAVAVDSAANADLATLEGNAVVVDSAATPEQAILDGTAVVVDCDANELHRTTASYGAKAATVVNLLGAPVTSTVGEAAGGGLAWLSSKLGRKTTSGNKGCDPGCDVEEKSQERCFACGTPVAAPVEPGILNGTAVAVDSAANADLATLDGNAVVVDSAATPEQAILDGTPVVLDCDANELHRTTASYGAKATTVVNLLGAPVTSTVGEAAGGGLAWLSSKLGRKTTSGIRGCDPGCDVEEKSQERCFACGTSVAAATSLA